MPQPVPAPAEPLEPMLIVSRDESTTRHGVCALCWSGPGPLAGSVCPRHAPDQSKAICSRCLVTLEMLAVQFDPQLRLHIETPA
jgi:hypothetical protein